MAREGYKIGYLLAKKTTNSKEIISLYTYIYVVLFYNDTTKNLGKGHCKKVVLCQSRPWLVS